MYSDTSDDASSLVYIKSISFSLEFAFPTDETKSMNHQSLNSLREGDEIVVATADKASLEFAIKALREKIFTRPDIVFLVPEELNSTIMKNKYTCTVRVIN